MLNPTDEDLMGRVGKGDRAAFATLVERHRQRGMGLAMRIVGIRSDAEDIVQEAFVRVWVKAPQWELREGERAAKFTTWFSRVVINLGIDRKRRPTNEAIEDDDQFMAPELGAESVVAGREIGRRIAAAIAELPERQRIAITLCQLQGQSNAEAAKALDVSVSAIELLLVRARRSLRVRLADLMEI